MSTPAESAEGAPPDSPRQPVESALSELEVARELPIDERVVALENVYRLLAEALDSPVGGEGVARPFAAGV